MSQPKHLVQEADIGSGERGPGQQETDKMIEQVPQHSSATPNDAQNQPSSDKQNSANAQSGNPP
jgi:hypothetical protein